MAKAVTVLCAISLSFKSYAYMLCFLHYFVGVDESVDWSGYFYFWHSFIFYRGSMTELRRDEKMCVSYIPTSANEEGFSCRRRYVFTLVAKRRDYRVGSMVVS